jgi:hypothetical protein
MLPTHGEYQDREIRQDMELARDRRSHQPAFEELFRLKNRGKNSRMILGTGERMHDHCLPRLGANQ